MKLSERIRNIETSQHGSFRLACIEWADEIAQLEAELETLQKLDEIGAAGLAVENTRLEAENDRLRETIGDPIKVRLFAEHILEDPPLYIAEASELLMRIANALKARDEQFCNQHGVYYTDEKPCTYCARR